MAQVAAGLGGPTELRDLLEAHGIGGAVMGTSAAGCALAEHGSSKYGQGLQWTWMVLPLVPDGMAQIGLAHQHNVPNASVAPTRENCTYCGEPAVAEMNRYPSPIVKG